MPGLLIRLIHLCRWLKGPFPLPAWRCSSSWRSTIRRISSWARSIPTSVSSETWSDSLDHHDGVACAGHHHVERAAGEIGLRWIDTISPST